MPVCSLAIGFTTAHAAGTGPHIVGKPIAVFNAPPRPVPKKFMLDREFNVELPVSLPANGRIWFVIE